MDVNQEEQRVEDRDELMIKSDSTTGPYVRKGYFLKPQRCLHGEFTEAVLFLPTLNLSNADHASEPACKVTINGWHMRRHNWECWVDKMSHSHGDAWKQVHGMLSQMDPTLVAYCNKVAEQGGPVIVLVFMCYGEKLQEKAREIEMVHLYRTRLLSSTKFEVVSWLLVLLFEAKKEHKRGGRGSGGEWRYIHLYVDSLLDVKLAEEGGRRLTDEEMVALCAEFMNAGTDSWTTLRWVMAELVIHQDVQDWLYKEIQSIVENRDYWDKEVLMKVSYFAAVVLEMLRCRPPAHFTLPHKTTDNMWLASFRT